MKDTRIVDPWICNYCGLIVGAKDALKTWATWRDQRRGLVGAMLACCPDEMCIHAAKSEHPNFKELDNGT